MGRTLAAVGSTLLSLTACYQRPDIIPPAPDRIPFVVGGCAAARDATVACTLDGDTFDLGGCGGDNERIRMLGINAPEIAHEEPAECWGDLAAAQLQRVLEGRRITLTFDQECTDVYGRTLAYAWVEDDLGGDGGEVEDTDGQTSTLVNLWMVENGYARLYKEEWVEPLVLQTEFDQAEARARARGLGLWGDCETDGG